MVRIRPASLFPGGRQGELEIPEPAGFWRVDQGGVGGGAGGGRRCDLDLDDRQFRQPGILIFITAHFPDSQTSRFSFGSRNQVDRVSEKPVRCLSRLTSASFAELVSVPRFA